MNLWERWLDGLDSPGGHICVLLVLFGAGVVMATQGVSKADDVLVGAFAALLAVLRGTISNKSRQNGGQS